MRRTVPSKRARTRARASAIGMTARSPSWGTAGGCRPLSAAVLGRAVRLEVLHRPPHDAHGPLVVSLGRVPHAGRALDDALEEVPVGLAGAHAPHLFPDLVRLPVQAVV